MKIGTSLGKCVKSLLDGEVKYEDVMFVVSNTMCPDLAQLQDVIEQYYYEFQGDVRQGEYDMTAHSLEAAQAIAQQLLEDGKLHQPRCVSTQVWGNAHMLKDTWYDLMPSKHTDSESVQQAWDHYVMIKQLAT